MITRPNFVSNNFDIHVSDVSIESDFNKKKALDVKEIELF